MTWERAIPDVKYQIKKLTLHQQNVQCTVNIHSSFICTLITDLQKVQVLKKSQNTPSQQSVTFYTVFMHQMNLTTPQQGYITQPNILVTANTYRVLCFERHHVTFLFSKLVILNTLKIYTLLHTPCILC